MKLKKKEVSIVLILCIFLLLSPINIRAIEKKVDVIITKESFVKESNTNTISYSLNILNQGVGEIDLSKLEINYWDTDDKVSNELVSVDWSSMQKDKIKVQIVKNEKILEDCNGSIKLQFLDNYILKQGESQQIHIRLYNSNYLEYN